MRALTPSEQVRLFAGLAVQPFVAAGAAFIGFPLFLLDATGRTLAGGFPQSWMDAAVSVASGVAFVTFFVTIVAVVPSVVWMVRRHRVTLPQALVFGLGFGNLTLLLLALWTGGGYRSLLHTHAFASFIGLTGAAVFWLISVRGRDFSRDPPGAG